jgi:hypothetical protein
MEKFWEYAIKIGGTIAIGLYVFNNLYEKFLDKKIFPMLNQEFTFILLLFFLIFVYLLISKLMDIIKHKPSDSNSSNSINIGRDNNGNNIIGDNNHIMK